MGDTETHLYTGRGVGAEVETRNFQVIWGWLFLARYSNLFPAFTSILIRGLFEKRQGTYSFFQVHS